MGMSDYPRQTRAERWAEMAFVAATFVVLGAGALGLALFSLAIGIAAIRWAVG
jgi:hypothetical protein